MPQPTLVRTRGRSSGFPVTLAPLTEILQQRVHRALGLTDPELERICELLEREPNHFELAVFSLLWSEHCGYKHSAALLKRLPSSSPRVLGGPGENAGVIALGGGEAVAFKVESHNHPSAVEPFQGAATGIGGIIRDVVAVGARPIALLDALRFGEPGWAFERAVDGISHYGNAAGIATVGGEARFDPSYRDNCLVNAMCVGLLPTERLTGARAKRPGDLVVLYGATTGRDGIGGASVLASQELGESDEAKRPSVQIGDPFTGKKLIEASLELVERGLVASLQDCGAAGLASALAEMAGDGAGIDVDLDLVPRREPELEPWEVMISESQERMVAVVDPALADAVAAVCRRWELVHAAIGEVTESGDLRCFSGGDVVGSIPARLLTDEAPRYAVERRPRRLPARGRTGPASPADDETLLRLLATSNVRSRAWIYGRYDQLVGSRTVRRPGLDAAVLRLSDGRRGLAVSLDGPGGALALAPRARAAGVVFEAARNVACAGGEPLALTDCLNFGNPEKPEIGWELAESIEGLAEAAEALGIPVVSGNVSLYNETEGRAIDPTPVVGCVGLVADVRRIPGAWHEGDAVFLAGEPELSLGGSEFEGLLGSPGGAPAALELAAEAALVELLWRAAPSLSLAHDVSAGGLAVCLVQCALLSGIGAELELPSTALELYGEGGGRAVVGCAPEEVVGALEGRVPLRRLGTVGGDSICGFRLDRLRNAWEARA